MTSRGVRFSPRRGFSPSASSDGLQVGPCQPYLREAPANLGLERLARAFMNSLRPSIANLSIQGDEAMTQGILVWGSRIALLGLILVLVLDILLDLLGDDPHHDKRQGLAPPKQHDGIEPHLVHHGNS